MIGNRFTEIVASVITILCFCWSCGNTEKDNKIASRQNIIDSLTIQDDIRGVKVVKRPRALYPSSAKSLGKKGKVAVKISLGIDGKVTKAETVWSTDKVFEAAAESLAYQYVFEPARYDDQPRPGYFYLPITFDPDSTEEASKE
jgi:TonB family protein